MKLVIVESPKKAKTIEKYLGSDFRVRASGGHICDLPTRNLGIEIDNNYKPVYEINPDKVRTLEALKQDVAKAKEVYLATDPDREGEAISWHLATNLGLPPTSNNRIEFHEISKKAVTNALAAPRQIDMNLVNAQQARRVLDRLVGYKISPVISRKIKPGLSAGRVQSAALRMLVDREREVRGFVPQEYWTLQALLHQDDSKIKATFEEINGKKHRIESKAELDEMLAKMKGKDFVVDSVKKAVRKSFPQPPFTTSTLQQDATSKFAMSAPTVMQIAQQLYEGVEIDGEGHVALVTYIRTDSVRVSTDAIFDARRYIEKKYGADYLPKSPVNYKTSNQAQDAHEAIRPISLDRTPESMKKKLSHNNYLVYKLIYDRFVASQMMPALYNTLDIRVGVQADADQNYGFHTKGRALKFAGYTAAYSEVKTSDSDEETGDITSPMQEGDVLTEDELKYEQKFTKPPQRYSESSLIKAMEENGIGRPSTYATIISVLSKRAYTTREGKYMAATELGERVVDEMNKHFSDILDLKFTANMEKSLDDIADGKREWQNLIADFYPAFLQHVIEAAHDTGTKKPAEETDVKCPKCGAFMVIKEGRNGKFLACPNYPACKSTMSLDTNVVGKCPRCGRDVVEKMSKSGKKFYGCTGYNATPKCDFAAWDLPAPYFCPECGATMKQINYRGLLKYKCTKCAHVEVIADNRDKKDDKKE
ncbi:MAG: type I DNA topoisomerase [Clostridia bacterium]|nr:type I DNA topoisomerase [Clostridia bacterium]